MEQIIVKHLDNSELKLNSPSNVRRIKKAEQTVELLGQDVVNISVESALKLTFSIGDKITIIGRDYTLNTPPVERKLSERHFIYDLQFEGVQYDMLRASFSVNVDTTSNQIQDLNGESLAGDLKRFLDVILSNLNRVFPGKWVLGTYPAVTETRNETFSDTDNCLSVLQSLCSPDKYNTEFDIQIAGNGVRTLNIRASGTTHTHTFEYGKGKGVYELSRQKVSSSNIINRLWTFGGSRNVLTTKYRAFKLCLPGKTKGQSYLEDAASISKYGVWEGTKNFDDIFPHRTGSITSLGTGELEFIDTFMDFDLNEKDVNGNTLYLIDGTRAKIRFNTGNLAGYEFEIESYDHATKKFRLIPQKDENGYVFPSPEFAAFQMAVGNQYVITDIYLPQAYITAAENELSTAGSAYLARYSQPLVSYGLELDPVFLRDVAGADVDTNIIWVGDYIPVKDTDLDVDKTIRVKAFTRDLLSGYSYSLTIADLTTTVSTISRVISELGEMGKLVRLNNLRDPARSRRNWMASQELLNMVFDVEGDYYSEKIKPASIDTMMLSVGAKSMQFILSGTVFEPNYAGNENRIVYRGGTISHYTIDPAGEKSWTIADGDVTFPASGTAYYIYAKVERAGTAGSILFSTSQISVEEVAGYYHFWIGVISSVDATLGTRLISLTYGFTTINGRYISTGRIQSADGQTFFDLDSGVIQGTLKFSSGESVEEAINEAVQTNSYWSIRATAPVIYKDAPNASTSGSHSSVVLTGELHTGGTTSTGGYLTVTPDGGAEGSPSASPVTIQPGASDGRTSYTVKLYDDAVKTTLLDTMTIPVVFKGASGVSALSVVLSNEADVIPASSTGVVSDYTGSGTTIRVFEGDTELTYDGIGTASGKFNVTGVGTNITPGSKAASGSGVAFGVVSGMNADLAYITFTISGKTAAGTPFSLTRTQNFSKARAGIKGDAGADGVPGTPGADGITYYTWIRYADDVSGNGISNDPTGKTYIGLAYNKTTPTESNIPGDYSWSLIKGDQGVPGTPGADGTTYYTWIKYSDNADGTGLYDTPTASTLYIGIAVNKTTPTESSVKTDYVWSRFKGYDGSAGVSITDVDVEYAQSADPSTAPTSGWTTTAPTWSNGVYIWTRTKTYYSNATTTTSNPVNLTGAMGPAGSPGATGTSITALQEQYYLSTSSSTQTGGSWSTTPPTWVEGKYIWTRIMISYSNPVSTGYTTPVLAKEWQAIQEAKLSAEGYMVFRYIRDFTNGWIDKNGTTGTDNRFNEIVVTRKDGTNVAQGKPVTSNGTNNPSYPLSRVTNGNINDTAIPTIAAGSECMVQVDLGAVYSDIASVKIYHDFNNEKMFYGTRTYVSIDGVSWINIFDSSIHGRYKETNAGHRISMLKTEIASKALELDAKNRFMTTIDGGLIYTALMKLFDVGTLEETAFISGQQGASQNYPAFGAGGTFAEALGLATFLAKMNAGTTPNSGEYNALPAITMLHNGAAKIGDFIVEASGRISMVDPSTGKPRLIFNITNIPSLETLLGSTVYSESENNPLTGTSTSVYLTYGVDVTQNGSTIRFQASSLQISATANPDGPGDYGAASARLELHNEDGLYTVIDSVAVMVPYGDSDFAIRSNIDITLTGMPIGIYSVRLVVTNIECSYAYGTLSASTISWDFTQSGVRYFQFGLNGMMAFFSDNHMHFTETTGLDVRGATNLPGVLMSGVVSSAGSMLSVWGGKKGSGSASRLSTGQYRVNHAIGHTDYAVLVTPNENRTFYVTNKTTSTFDVRIYTTGSSPALYDTEFNFAVFGNNYV